jgi:YegS/Rv2252/BmrU family lipid kinase
MNKQRVKLIVNPNADLGRAWRVASDLIPIVEEFGGADWSGTVYPTHAVELARQAGDVGYDMVVAVGGDGTVHEVVNGLMQVSEESRPRLGVVPLGSGNDFAHALGIPLEPHKALRQALNGTPKPVDIGRLSDGRGRVAYFDNTVGIGFDATVTIRSRQFAYARGFLIYFLAVLQTILLNHEAICMKVETDRETWEEEMLMLTLCNGPREGGGFAVAPDARIDDGIFQYASVRKVSRPMMLRLLPEVMNGTHPKFPQVRMGEFLQLAMEADRPVVVHIDGEIFAGFGTDTRRLEIAIQPGALEVMV